MVNASEIRATSSPSVREVNFVGIETVAAIINALTERL